MVQEVRANGNGLFIALTDLVPTRTLIKKDINNDDDRIPNKSMERRSVGPGKAEDYPRIPRILAGLHFHQHITTPHCIYITIKHIFASEKVPKLNWIEIQL
jgi:hypothetical protein